MLPSALLMHRYHGEEVVPRRLALTSQTRTMAAELIALFRASQGSTRGELHTQLQILEGEQTDYRVKRGLAYLLENAFSTFETHSPVAPAVLRQHVFAQAASTVPGQQATAATLTAVAEVLGRELEREISPEVVHAGLYADLPEQQLLTSFTEPTPEALIQRYNLSQAQGVLYRASHVCITAHRNDPGEYKLLFRYLKLFGLMAYIEGDADHGFTLTIDGPTSLFKPSTRYGLALAKLLPALLHVSRWQLRATLVSRPAALASPGAARFSLDSACELVSHYPPGKPHDSMLEQAFAARWERTKTAWQLEREVDLLPLPGSVMVPDFRLVHPDGRSFLLEIVGYWRPEYLRKKFYQIRRAARHDLIVAISERLNLDRAGVKAEELPGRIVWFKDKLLPKAVLEILDAPGEQ